MKVKKLIVAETFFSIQGEGSTMGVPAYFLRLGGCNLLCGGKGTDKDKELHNGATWRCDSIEVWQKSRGLTFAEIVTQMGGDSFIFNLRRGAHLVITGGEPLMQQATILDFLYFLREKYSLRPRVEIETNGTISPSPYLTEIVLVYNVSPKLSNSGEPDVMRINNAAIKEFKRSNKAIFKFVISSLADFLEMGRDFLQEFILPNDKVYLMPAADNREDLQKVSETVAQLCIEHCLRYSHRLHITIWNTKTGK